MGKGDQKSRRGKIQVGSFGNLRPRKKTKPAVAAQPVVKEETPVVEKKAAPKKAAPKKAAK